MKQDNGKFETCGIQFRILPLVHEDVPGHLFYQSEQVTALFQGLTQFQSKLVDCFLIPLLRGLGAPELDPGSRRLVHGHHLRSFK